jgi:hypothetical protein
VRIEILEDAERELDEAIAYYEKIEPGLGIRLKAEARGLSNGFFSTRNCRGPEPKDIAGSI